MHAGWERGRGDWGSQATSLYHTHIVYIRDAICMAGQRSFGLLGWREGGKETLTEDPISYREQGNL
jgi:hypothetical protein